MSKLFSKNKTVRVEIPETWREVSPAHLYQFVKVFNISDTAIRMRKSVEIVMREYVDKVQPKDVITIYNIMTFLHPREVGEDGQPIFEEEKLLIYPIIDKIADGLVMPEKEMENITCRQFLECETGLQKMANGDDIEGSKQFLEAFFHHKIEYILRKCKGKQINYIFKFYNDCKEMIFQRVRIVAPTFFESEKDANKVDFGWGGTFMQVAEGGTFGTYDEVLNAKFHDVLFYLLQSWIKYQEQKKEEAKNK